MQGQTTGTQRQRDEVEGSRAAAVAQWNQRRRADRTARTGVQEIAASIVASFASRSRGWAGALALVVAQFLGLLFIAALVSGEAAWSAAALTGLAGALAALLLANRATLAHVALEHANLEQEALGAVCEGVEWPDLRVRRVCSLLLTHALRRLKPADAWRISKDQRNCLFRRLSPRAVLQQPDLALSILRALPIIGTESAAPNVERLTRLLAFTPTRRRIRNEARTVLPMLRERLTAERAAADRLARVRAPGDVALLEIERTEIDAARAQADAQLRDFESELRKVRQPGMRLGFLVAAWTIVVPFTLTLSISGFTSGSWLVGTLFALLTLAATQLYRLTLSGKHQMLAQRLSRIDDVRCIGRLCELLEWPDAGVRDVVIAGLTRLLPRARASDNPFATPSQRMSLYKMLDPLSAYSRSRFLVTVLKALEQIGDSAAVPFVTRIANMQPSTDREQELCNAATDCLPFLLQRSRLNETSHSLLRASAATAAGADELMRAASAAPAADPDELLRANAGLGES
jgi:hypothetical protein